LNDTLAAVLFVVAWAALQMFVLPRLGVST
jgi:hypothetical protein